MKCLKCGEVIEDGFDWNTGETTGAETGVCEKCWTARIDRMTNTIRNAEGGFLSALFALDCGGLTEDRKKEIESGANPTEEEKERAIKAAKESGYLEEVSAYALELQD